MGNKPANSTLRTYPIPLRGEPLLVCGKCQKKLKKSSDPDLIRSLKKSFKACAKEDADPVRIRILYVPCLKMCPKDALTVVTQGQLARGQCSIVRNAEEVAALYALCKGNAVSRESEPLGRQG